MEPARGAEPIGRHVSRVGRVLARAFDAALAETGGSLSTWLVVLSLKQARWRTQQELARAVGIKSPTLTRHLDNLEQAGLVARSRDPGDRRVMRIELTAEGDAAFHRMRQAAAAFDERLRTGFADGELEQLRDLLIRLETNAEMGGRARAGQPHGGPVRPGHSGGRDAGI